MWWRSGGRGRVVAFLACGGVGDGPGAGLAGPLGDAGGGDFFHEVGAFHGGGGLGGFDGFFFGKLGGQAGLHGAAGAEALGEGAGVEPLDAGDSMLGEEVGEGLAGAPVGDEGGEFADGEGAGVGLAGLVILRGDAVVPDHGAGEGDDLAAVGGVGEDLLVAGHGGVEAGFPGGGAGVPEGGSVEKGAVGEGEEGGLGHGSGRDSGIREGESIFNRGWTRMGANFFRGMERGLVVLRLGWDGGGEKPQG